MLILKLGAHLGEEKFFNIFLPSQTMGSTQPIDSGSGRSVRGKLGHILCLSLMDEENMLKWEGKMTVSKRRALTNQFFAEVTEKVM